MTIIINGKVSENAIPNQDSADNNTMADVLGNKTDTHDGDSVYALSEIQNDHVHKAAKVFPTLGAGVTVTGAAGAWTLGNYAEVAAANDITSDFDIHYIVVEDISATGVYELVLYAATTEIGRIRLVKSAAQDSVLSHPFQCAIQPANTQIQAKLASSSGGGDTITISLEYHEY